MSFTLYVHQRAELNYLTANRCFALFAEQGTGKTLPTLQHILNLLKAGNIGDALILCPKAVAESWHRDMEKFPEVYQNLLRCKVTVMSYDIVWRRPETLRRWGCIVLDESHFIKHRTSRRAKFILKLGELADYRYILTGTPIGNSHWEEIWAQYRFLDPHIFGRYADFEKRYCILNQFYKPYRYVNTEELKEKMLAHAFRITKAECLELPEKLPPQRYVLENQERRLYREMLDNYIEDLDIEAKNPLARLTKLRQMCSGFLCGEDGALHRLKCGKAASLAEFLDNWDKKLVVFAEYRQSIRDICGVLEKLRIPYVTLDGEQNNKAVWKQFQADPGIGVIVCQYRSASAGIDLFAADTILFYEPTLSSQIFEQACDRIHRVGQRNRCSYILFETKGTVEQRMWNALAAHRDFDEHELWAYVKEAG